jgi:hypothetical protein
LGNVTDRQYELHEYFLVDVGLGFPLAHRGCCDMMVSHMGRIVSSEGMSVHNAAIAKLAKDFAQFLKSYASLEDGDYSRMALGSEHHHGPSTLQHLRTLGHRFNGGAPFPVRTIVFDGEQLLCGDLE